MTSRRSPQVPQSRRDRRAAERATQQRTTARKRGSRAPLMSPIALATSGAVLVGLVIIVVLTLQNSGGPGPVVNEPTTTTPPGLAHGSTLGSDAAPVKLEAYSDFQCPN